jgi:hypothetical protein
MEEEEARLALLQTELNNLQNAMRNMDSIVLQINGWCVTVSLAIGGLAVTYHNPALIAIGEGAIVGFFIINCQFKMFQRTFINRNLDIDSELKRVGIMDVLKGAAAFEVVGTATYGRDTLGESLASKVRRGFPAFWFEARRASTFSLYAFLALFLLIEFIVLL